jgi:hypothetical protein
MVDLGDDEDEFETEFGEEHLEESITELGQWLEDSYAGDDRFEYVELNVPGVDEEEAFRLRLVVDEATEFFVAFLEEDNMVRVGLATEDAAVSDAIEEAMLESGGTMTEFIAEAVDAEDELEHEVQFLNEDSFYFCSDIPYESDAGVNSETQRDAIVYYLDGFIGALLELAQDAS